MQARKLEIQNQIIQAVDLVKKTNPMAGSITNTVTINFVANAQIAIGGSAAMVFMPDEAETLSKMGAATYVNVGTIIPVYDETLPRVAETLYKEGKPWILDPVAVGIGDLRERVLRQFKFRKPSIIRGNASEILALAGLWELEGGTGKSNVRGVDSTDSVIDAMDAAIALAKWTNGAVAVSGETDLVTDGSIVVLSYGGSHFMDKITGSGCALGGVIAIYSTVTSPFIAALTGTAVFNLAGNRAEKVSGGPGSFQVAFLDELYNATAYDIANNPLDIKEV
ncbi:MAG: hydroxyethylthiazole kinase [Euryarchaeota archaeon]|nr:hydroxyethylthiazole kinase [Euryarchaeota archaeon]